jgi:hypothetical protein
MFLTTNEVNPKMDRRTFITSTTAATVGLATNAILPKLAQGKETVDTPTQSYGLRHL